MANCLDTPARPGDVGGRTRRWTSRSIRLGLKAWVLQYHSWDDRVGSNNCGRWRYVQFQSRGQAHSQRVARLDTNRSEESGERRSTGRIDSRRRCRFGPILSDRSGPLRGLHTIHEIWDGPLYGAGGILMKQLSPYIIERTVDELSPHRPFANRPSTDEMAGIGLAECWKVISAHRRLIGEIIAATLALTAAVVFTMTPRYVASATLLIEPEPPRLMDVSSMLQMMQNDRPDADDYTKTQYSLLRDDQLVAQVIHELNLESNPHFAQSPGPIKHLIGLLSQ